MTKKGINSTTTCLEPSHHHFDDDASFILSHTDWNAEEHENVVTVRNSQGIQITQHIRTSYLSL